MQESERAKARNVEIKARVGDLAALRRRVLRVATTGPRVVEQRDTFFPSARGRLKLRQFGDGSGELIFYERPDRPGPRTSTYLCVPCAETEALREALTGGLGVRGEVVKRREVFLAGRTRIHLDEVQRLGSFVELEVVLEDGESPADGESEARELMRALGVSSSDCLRGAYVDLLEAASAGPPQTSWYAAGSPERPARLESTMPLRMTTEEREAFLADLHVGVLSIPDGDAGPLACPIWYAYEPGGEITLVTGKGSRKAAALRRAKRVSFVVQTEELPYKYVSVEGPVVDIADADTGRDVRPLAHRYLGREGGDAYIEATRGDAPEGNVVVRIRPERWLTVDYAKQLRAP